VVDLDEGVVPTNMVHARAAVAFLELGLRRHWLTYVGVAIPTVLFAVVF